MIVVFQKIAVHIQREILRCNNDSEHETYNTTFTYITCKNQLSIAIEYSYFVTLYGLEWMKLKLL